jgi:tRNA(Ile)-lysidine synthase
MIPEGGCEWFDADQVGPTVLLRHWSSGDRFQPIGMKGSVKLQDWFTNRKVPAARRRRLVVATTMDGEIFWIEGQRISERFKLDKATRRRLKWVWHRVGGLPRVGGNASVRRIF